MNWAGGWASTLLCVFNPSALTSPNALCPEGFNDYQISGDISSASRLNGGWMADDDGDGWTDIHLPYLNNTLAISGHTGAQLSFVTRDLSIVPVGEGAVQGFASSTNKSYSFLGIPYAAPPTGSLRWQPPAPAAFWQSVEKAGTFSNPCMQTSVLGSTSASLIGSEDCLYLNVFAPAGANATSKLPVIVWIHGGDGSWGSAATKEHDQTDVDYLFDGHYMAEHSNVVVVTLNYRLGPLGFLDIRTFERNLLTGAPETMDTWIKSLLCGGCRITSPLSVAMLPAWLSRASHSAALPSWRDLLPARQGSF